jgi:hypothetical protein
MLKNLKRWLGLDRDSRAEPPAGANGARRPPPRSKGAGTGKGATRPGAQPQKAAGKKKRGAMDLLDNPRLSLERPDEGFDPYNTGAFNRSQSWERIGKKKR